MLIAGHATPRYASSTRGSRWTSSGGPVAIVDAVVEHDHRVAQPHDEVHVVLDDEKREPARVQLADVALHRLDHHRVDPGGGLVEQHEPRLAHQERGELEQLALAERERPGAVAGHAGQPELLEQRVGALALGARRAPCAAARARAAAATTARFSSDRQLGEDPRPLERAREPGAREPRRVGPVHVAAGEDHRPGVGRQVAGDQVEGRRLARAVRPDQRRDACPPRPRSCSRRPLRRRRTASSGRPPRAAPSRRRDRLAARAPRRGHRGALPAGRRATAGSRAAAAA